MTSAACRASPRSSTGLERKSELDAETCTALPEEFPWISGVSASEVLREMSALGVAPNFRFGFALVRTNERFHPNETLRSRLRSNPWGHLPVMNVLDFVGGDGPPAVATPGAFTCSPAAPA